MVNQAIFRVEDVFSIEGKGIVVVGKLIEGAAKRGMKAVINGKQSEILLIESQNKSLESLIIGVPAGLFLSNIKKDDVQRGSIYYFQ